MVYYDYLVPRYARQKSFYNKATLTFFDDCNFKTIKLFSDNINKRFVEVAKIVIDKKHASKNRYYITSNTSLLNNVTLKHIYDFLFQYYEHKTTKSKLLRRDKFIKDKVFKYALSLD